jgi:hypothetical protein
LTLLLIQIVALQLKRCANAGNDRPVALLVLWTEAAGCRDTAQFMRCGNSDISPRRATFAPLSIEMLAGFAILSN